MSLRDRLHAAELARLRAERAALRAACTAAEAYIAATCGTDAAHVLSVLRTALAQTRGADECGPAPTAG